MNPRKLNILFLLDRSKLNKQGKCPIKCRLTYLGKRKTFSTGQFIEPNKWFSKQQKAKPPNKENNFINTQLSLIKQEINQAFLFLQVNQNQFDVDDIYLQYKGKNVKANKTLLEVFQLHNDNMLRLVGKEYTNSTYNKFVEAKKHTKNFIRHQYNKSDYLLNNLKLKFLNDFDFYLKSEKNHKQITINKSIQRVRKIIKLALAEGYLTKDPFILYRPKKYKVKVVYLDTKELKKLEEYSFTQVRLQQVKDMFVFCCYTGLAYAEMTALSKDHIVDEFDGNKWVKMYRKKTNSYVSVPLLPIALGVLYKYDLELPRISNQKFNSYLKEIANIVGIEKKLTHHVARKTFATTVLLYNGVPMEVVSELLGHSKMNVTQKHYGKIVQKKISNEINKLKTGLV
ncbi:site-specific integrase [Pseudofulvibacter geojedonensis]|uniref:Tyrosine-type recombinase/integrase n=1 Tax=Pseudofulvibacter geojedonensis TaxID=1123758 RepID=A0ABW3I340_9FLAO